MSKFAIPKHEDWSMEELRELLQDSSAEEMAKELVNETINRLDKVTAIGGEIQALCPFHADKNVGSFYLNANSGLFFCFSCGAKGDFSRLSHKLGVAKRGAFNGLKLSALIPLVLSGRDEESNIAPPVEDLPELPENVLDHMEAVTDWRGHMPSTLAAFEVKHDPVYNRIVFPVRRYDGALLGMQSRALSEHAFLRWKFYKSELPSIGNWDEDTILTLYMYEVPRGSTFFGEQHNWQWFARKTPSPLVLCEGPGHFLRITESGYTALATFGTSVSERQRARIIEGLEHRGDMPDVILCYDGDFSGRRATQKLAEQISSYCNLLVAVLPEGKDPEDLTIRELRQVLRDALPFFEVSLEQTAFTPDVCKEIWNEDQ